MRDAIMVAGTVALAIVLGAAGLIAVANLISRADCAASWEASGFRSRYSFLGGCRVEIDGRWVPAATVRKVTP